MTEPEETAFNICEFFPDDVESNLKLLDETLELLYDHRNSNMQGELRLYKARYLYDRGETEEALDCFNVGYYLLACQKNRAAADERARKILKERFEILKQA